MRKQKVFTFFKLTYKMEMQQTKESIFQRIMNSPGLSFIADDIFLFLDVKTMIRCIEVCSLWKWHIIENRLLRRKVLKNKDCSQSNFSSAPEGSHNRQLLRRLLGSDIVIGYKYTLDIICTPYS